jgi:putative ABC transport system permease protein
VKTAPLRAAARIASRNARRHRRRSILVVVMIALPVALVSATATVARTTVSTAGDAVAGTMGRADLILSTGHTVDSAELTIDLPRGSEVVVTHFEELSVILRAELFAVTMLEPDAGLDSPVLDGLYELESGRAPRAAGEVALHADVLSGFEARIGSEVILAGHSLTVTGLARAPQDLDHQIAVVGPGTLGKGEFSNVLIELPNEADVTAVAKLVRPLPGSVRLRRDLARAVVNDAGVYEVASLAGGILALFGTGLVAAAAFVVGARRQLRELGMVGAIGGEPRHVRAVVWLGGTTLGLAGGVLGAAAGVGLAYAVRPFLDQLVGRVVGPVEVNVFVLVAAAAMGTLAATAAALAPARAAGKMSAVEALAGRTPPPRPPGRVAALGVLVLAAGGGITAWGTVGDYGVLVAAGLVGMLVGILLAIPMLVSFVGKVANRLPTTARLAARDAARHGRRTGAAVAAAVIALGAPVAIATYSLSEETFERQSPRLGPDQLLVGGLTELPVDETDAVVTAVETSFPDAVVAPLYRAVPAGRHGSTNSVYALGAVEESTNTVYGWELFIAGADALRAVHAETGIEALDDGKAVVLGGYTTDGDVVTVSVPGRRGREERVEKVPAVAVDSPAYFNESIPRIVISDETARGIGLRPELAHHLLTAPAPLSGEQIDRARAVDADHPGFYVFSADDYLPEYALARTAATAASIPLALAVLGVAVALVVSESRRSHQILVALGAGPLTHRKLVAATAALLAVITGLLAVPAGVLPTVVVQLASGAGRPLVVPWPTIAIILLATPFLSAAIAGLAARSPKLESLVTPGT